MPPLDAQRSLDPERERDEDQPRERRSARLRTGAAANPCVRMYFVTLRLSAQSRTAARSMSSTVDNRSHRRTLPSELIRHGDEQLRRRSPRPLPVPCMSESSCSSCRTRGTSARPGCSRRSASRRSPRRAQGFAWALGKHDQHGHSGRAGRPRRESWPRRRPLPLNVDSERCYPGRPRRGGRDRGAPRRVPAQPASRSRTMTRPRARIDDVELAPSGSRSRREAAHALADPLVLTGRRGEPHPRRRRPRRHDRAPDRLPGRRCRRRVCAGPAPTSTRSQPSSTRSACR